MSAGESSDQKMEDQDMMPLVAAPLSFCSLRFEKRPVKTWLYQCDREMKPAEGSYPTRRERAVGYSGAIVRVITK